MSSIVKNRIIGLIIISIFVLVLVFPYFLIFFKPVLKSHLTFGIIIIISYISGTILSLWTFIMANQSNPGFIKQKESLEDIELNNNKAEKIKKESEDLKKKINEIGKKIKELEQKKNSELENKID